MVALPQPSERWRVEMIVVIVADEDRVNRGKVLKANAGIAVARRTGKGNRAGASRPDGIREEIAARRLEQHSGVIDESHAEAGTVHLNRWRWAWSGGNPRGPGAGLPVFNPPIKLAEPMFGGSRVEKTTVAEVFVQMSLCGLRWRTGRKESRNRMAPTGAGSRQEACSP